MNQRRLLYTSLAALTSLASAAFLFRRLRQQHARSFMLNGSVIEVSGERRQLVKIARDLRSKGWIEL